MQIIKLVTEQSPQAPVTSSFLGPSIFLSTLISNTLSPCFFFNETAQVSYQHKRKGKLIALCFWTASGRQKTLHRILADIPRVQPLLNFLMNTYFSGKDSFRITEICLVFNRFIPQLSVLTLLYILFKRHNLSVSFLSIYS